MAPFFCVLVRSDRGGDFCFGSAYANIGNMADRRSNRNSFIIDGIVIVLSIAVVLAGVVLCMYASKQLIEATKIDANALMRSPSEYMDVKRDMVVEGLSFMIPGIVILLLGEFVLSVMTSRLITIAHEGRQLASIEKRLEKLEKKSKK